MSTWEIGDAVPDRRKWPIIEDTLDLPVGTLARFYGGAEAAEMLSSDGTGVVEAVLADRALDNEDRALMVNLYRRLTRHR